MSERADKPAVPPIMFGESIPAGRVAGDCSYCTTDPATPEKFTCDCALEWVAGASGVHFSEDDA